MIASNCCRIGGWTIASRSSSAGLEAKTIEPKARRSIAPREAVASGPCATTRAPNRSITWRRTSGCSSTSWPTRSASITTAPRLPSSAATWLLPPPIAPVKPITGTAPCFHRTGNEANEKAPEQDDDMVLLETTIGHGQGRESRLGLDGRTTQAAGSHRSMNCVWLVKWEPPCERLHPRDSHDLSRSEIRASGLMKRASRKPGQAGGGPGGSWCRHLPSLAVLRGKSEGGEMKRVTGNRLDRQPINSDRSLLLYVMPRPPAMGFR